MENIYSVIDMGKLGLDIERLKVKVSAENIANVNNSAYTRQAIDFEKILTAFDDVASGSSIDGDSLEAMSISRQSSGGAINLDREVVDITNAEMRYKSIAQIVQKKFGLLELAMNGGKK